MTLAPGARLGRYEILSPLGAGGMGEVYQARDVRLKRTVAIKVLPPPVEHDVERRARLLREGQAVASLEHPHICVLHDIGHHEGTDFLVMELLEGQTLEDRLRRGPVPLDQALRYGVEIARALDCAHRHGIVHRDLKPANVMLTKSGAKLMDFGLARQQTPPVNVSAGAAAETELTALTGRGTILGTLQYMAPEQLEGREADAQSDLFAFGAVLYEMVTGRRAFDGASAASVIASILEREPPRVETVQPLAPARLGHVVARAIAKDPDDRWRTAADLAAELQWLRDTPFSAEPRTRNHVRRWTGIAAALAALVVGAALGAWLARPDPSPRSAVGRFVLPTDEAGDVAISPDGHRIVYTDGKAGATRLYLRTLDTIAPLPLAGTEGARAPFFSPDGNWVAFFSGGQLRKLALPAGRPVTICDTSPVSSVGAWAPDDTIYFTWTSYHGLFQVPAAGGTATAFATPDLETGERGFSAPHVLPDGRTMLFTRLVGAALEGVSIVAQSLDTGGRRTVLEGGSHAQYLSSGHLLYTHGSRLLAVPFDFRRLEATFPAVPVLDGVWVNPQSGLGKYAVSRQGDLVYLAGGVPQTRTPVLVGEAGRELDASWLDGLHWDPALSPEGERLAVSLMRETQDLWVYDLPRLTPTRLTSRPAADMAPRWTPDGRRITFSSVTGSGADLFWMSVDGSAEPELLVANENVKFPSDWSPTGQVLAYVELDRRTNADIWLLHLQPERRTEPFARSEFDEGGPSFAPDGSWLAYHSNETGRYEVYVRQVGARGGKVRVSADGGREPRWARNGESLYYRRDDALMTVPIRLSPTVVPGTPSAVLQGTYGLGTALAGYDVAPDGRSFVMIDVAQERQVPPQLIVVQRWTSEVQQLLARP